LRSSIPFLLLLVFSSGCDDGEEAQSQASDEGRPLEDAGGLEQGPEPLFEIIDEADWNETAIRKILQIFAFGGFVRDEQIQSWAEQAPQETIQEIIHFDEHNPLLSPPELSAPPVGGLWALAESLSSEESPLSEEARGSFGIESWASPERLWSFASLATGSNPVRQRLGLFETNYHMVVNQEAEVNNWQLLAYYDGIMEDLSTARPYEEVLGEAALSAAIATQYNHRENRFIDARFEGNEDFAREFHQLFFGILGEEEPEYHEFNSIRNTAKALTGLEVERVEEGDETRLSEMVIFSSEHHYPGSLEILHQEIQGANTQEKIRALAKWSIQHPESLNNLPILIIQGLADDLLDEEDRAEIVRVWGAMEKKDLLRFLRSYAISTLFHSSKRIKYWSSIERNLIACNLITLDPKASPYGIYNPLDQIHREGVQIFRPTKDVFGGETGLDAFNSAAVFREAYNHSSDRYWFYARTEEEAHPDWSKDWSTWIPKGADGTWRLKAVSEWLWQRFITDDLKHLGTLERAYLYAYVGAGKDFGLFVDENNSAAVYSSEEIESRDSLQELMRDMELAILPLDSEDPEERLNANYRVGLGINFILATPYAFLQEGR